MHTWLYVQDFELESVKALYVYFSEKEEFY